MKEAKEPDHIGKALGRLFAFAILKKAEGTDWSALWSFAWTKSGDLSRGVRMHSDLKAWLAKVCPAAGLRIRCVTAPSRRKVPPKSIARCSLRWSATADVRCAAFDAMALVKSANKAHCAEDYRSACTQLARAAELCAQLFPIYDALHRLVSVPKGRSLVAKHPEEIQVLFAGMARMDQWLAAHAAAFSIDRIPSEYRQEAQAECIGEIESRRRLLDETKHLTIHDAHGGVLVVMNPVNVVLDHLCKSLKTKGYAAIKDTLTHEQAADFHAIIRDTVAYLEDDVATEALIKELRDEWNSGVGATLIRDVLSDIAQHEPSYRFPEPASQDTGWRTMTVAELAGRAFRRLRGEIAGTRGETSFDRMAGALPDQRNPDDTIKRLVRASSHQHRDGATDHE